MQQPIVTEPWSRQAAPSLILEEGLSLEAPIQNIFTAASVLFSTGQTSSGETDVNQVCDSFSFLADCFSSWEYSENTVGGKLHATFSVTKLSWSFSEPV